MNTENTDQYPLYTNDLIYESSPYLKQHANNPVNWKTWNKKKLNEDLVLVYSNQSRKAHDIANSYVFNLNNQKK